MRKYYGQSIFRLEDEEFFEDHETMLEYVREHWQDYARPVGDECKLAFMTDLDSSITLHYTETIFEGDTVSQFYECEHRMSYDTVEMTWLVSKLDRMVKNV